MKRAEEMGKLSNHAVGPKQALMAQMVQATTQLINRNGISKVILRVWGRRIMIIRRKVFCAATA